MIFTIYANSIKYVINCENENDAIEYIISTDVDWFSYKGYKINKPYKFLRIELSITPCYTFSNLAKLYKFEKWKIPSNIMSFKEKTVTLCQEKRDNAVERDLDYTLSKYHTLTYETFLELKRTRDISLFNVTEISNDRTINFYPDEYLYLYPCFKGKFRNNKEMYQNYVKHGIKEGRLPNLWVLSIFQKENRRIACNEVKIFEETRGPESGILKDVNFYILTRTSSRPEKFLELLNFTRQIKGNVIHYIGYDTLQAKNYVEKEVKNERLLNLIHEKGKMHPNEYIDVFYKELEKDKANGWILVLDDDDIINTVNLFLKISEYLDNENRIIIWKLERPDKFIYPEDINNPQVGEIATCCYIYHTSKIAFNHWGNSGIGDFCWFKYLQKVSLSSSFTYLPYSLSRVNYENEISGWSAM